MNDIFGQPVQQYYYNQNGYTNANINYRPDPDPKPCLKPEPPKEPCSCHPDPKPEPHNDPCRQLPGTIFRINIPAGATINVSNLVELTSPSGICLILRLPFLAGECGQDVSDLYNLVRNSGGTIERVNM